MIVNNEYGRPVSMHNWPVWSLNTASQAEFRQSLIQQEVIKTAFKSKRPEYSIEIAELGACILRAKIESS